MNRDLTPLGCGFITGHLIVGFATQTFNLAGLIIATIGLALIAGSRYGWLGKVRAGR